jgi:curved DNA-binding protein CbpA
VSFIDYYETLEISPNANSETVERMFRYLAQRYHPDNLETGDRDRFDLILEAHNTLRDPKRRVEYDLEYKGNLHTRSKLAEEASDEGSIDRDTALQAKLLSIFYAKRRSNIREPGVGDAELANLLDCPYEHLEFHIWYLKEKKWIERREDGMLAITIDGVDRASAESQVKAPRRLLSDQS